MNENFLIYHYNTFFPASPDFHFFFFVSWVSSFWRVLSCENNSTERVQGLKGNSRSWCECRGSMPGLTHHTTLDVNGMVKGKREYPYYYFCGEIFPSFCPIQLPHTLFICSAFIYEPKTIPLALYILTVNLKE